MPFGARLRCGSTSCRRGSALRRYLRTTFRKPGNHCRGTCADEAAAFRAHVRPESSARYVLQRCLHRGDRLARRRENAEGRERASVDNGVAVHQHLVLTVVAVNHGDVDLKLAPKPRRGPDGVKSGDSVNAVAECYPAHKIPKVPLQLRYASVESALTPRWRANPRHISRLRMPR